MLETGRLHLVNPPRTAPLPEGLLERLSKRVFTLTERPVQVIHNPVDNSVLAAVPLCTAEDVSAAVRRAKVAQVAWAKTPARERSKVLFDFHDLLLARQEEVLDIVQLETGKSRRHAFDEIIDCAMNTGYYAVRAPQWLAPRRAGGSFFGLTKTWEYRHSVGVVGVIAPWNYPLTMAVTEPVAALMAGNAVVLKPDPQTSFSALWVEALMEEAGLPKGLFQVVSGAGEVGVALINAVDNLAFTGSTRTGRKVGVQAAERLIGASLELGGKNPMLVLEDANLEAAADGAVRGAFTNSGQLCIAIERIYVHEKVYNQFTGLLKAKTEALRLGSTLDHRTQIGTLTVERQFDVVANHVQDAVAKGAKVLVGGKARPDLGPLFFEPTVLENVTPEMRVYAEETFGPVVSLYSFGDLDGAIRRANDSEYGLNASVWTENLELGRTIASRIQAGTVNINEAYAAAWASMDGGMGGFKASGLGRRHGKEGLYRFTEAQTVAVERVFPLSGPNWLPRGGYAKIVTQVLRFLKFVMRLRYRV
ncbi:MAG: succinate-semialdehyde dehydrogenase (NADP(+)) [Thermaceae bacterium]|nr:succinate-semialdehyde dehydrogenase (NADP(+)) [Thermaceae bacterium]